MPASYRMRSALVLPFVILALTLGLVTGGVVAAPEASAATRGEKARTAVKIVKRQLGDPYRYGATGPGAFDCSGLPYFAYRKAGFRHMPRTSDAQARFTKRLRKHNMRRGDLMFFHNGGDVYHVAVFVGWKDGRRLMIHSPRSGSRVKYARPWTRSWFPGTLRWR